MGVRSVVARFGLFLAVLTLVGGGCLGASSASQPSGGDATSGQPLTVAPPSTDVMVRVLSIRSPSHRFGIQVRCPGGSGMPDNAMPAWQQACQAIAKNPQLFTNTHDVKSCIGGIATVQIHVTGMINGRRIDIRQATKCGPRGATAWYPLLLHHAPTRLPSWFAHA
jgi:hypothetical protein